MTRYPLAPTVNWEPAVEFRAFRADEPITSVTLPTGDTGWLVTRYEDNRAMLADNRFSRAAAAKAGSPRARRAGLEQDAITTSDPPHHTRLRRLVTSAFSSGRVAALTPAIEELVNSSIDEMISAGQPADLVKYLSQPVPMRVICALLGLPAADHDWFRDRAEVYLSTNGDIELAGTQLREYLGDAVAARRAQGTDDLLGALVAAGEDDQLTDREIVAFGVTLLMAGFAPTSHQLAGSVFALLHNPSQWARLRDDPALMPGAVEELLRFCPMPASGGTIRIATEDVELGGRTIRAGEAVLPALVSANRDERIFDRPDELDVGRTANPHMAFGHGIHRCLGAQLARAELRIALAALVSRLPGLRLAVPADQIPWQLGGMQRGPAELPVAW